MSNKYYDLAIIGAGSAGLSAAFYSSNKGLKTILIDNSKVGGTCVNHGCVPKKLLWHAALEIDNLKYFNNLGINVNNYVFNWDILKENIKKVILDINNSYEKKLSQKDIYFVSGDAKIISKDKVSLGKDTIQFKNLIIATGAKPHKINFPGSEFTIVSDDIFQLKKLPKNMIIVGAGYIAIEMACILNKFGVDITVVNRGNRIVKSFDFNMTENLNSIMQKNGIKILSNEAIEKITKEKEFYNIKLKSGKVLQNELVLLATGRTPDLSFLNQDKIQIDINDKNQIIVNDNFCTNINNIYAVGDCINTPMLTPVAKLEAKYAVKHILNETQDKINYNALPSALFSLPSITGFGVMSQKSNDLHEDNEIFATSFKNLKGGITKNEEKTFIKMIFDKKTEKLIGAHMLSNLSSEIMQTLCISFGNTKQNILKTVPLHPSIAEELIYLLD